MNHLLRKIFFWDEPAQGAFFGLTFFFVCSSLWFTLYQLLWLSNCGLVQLNIMSERIEHEIRLWAIVQLLIAAYSLAVFCRAIWLLGKSCHLLHNYRPLLCVLPSIVLCVCCLLFCLVPLAFLLKIISTYGSPFSTLPKWMSLFSNLPPQSWGIAYLFAVLLMTFGGFSIVAAVARGTAVPLRHSLCKPGIALWGVFWVVYCLLLALALMQSAALSPVSSILQKRFGYPLAAEGLREYYQNMGSADAEFWKGFKEKAELPSNFPIGNAILNYWNGNAPDELTPEFLTAFENYCIANEAPLRELEKCFDSVPPLLSYDFQPGNLSESLLKPPYASFRRFSKLELIRIHLQRKEKDEALRTYQHLSNCTEHLQREPFMIGSLIWIALEKVRLEAVERLLESRLLTEDDLRRLASDLTTLEERIPMIHRHAMFTEAVFGQDAFWSMEVGKNPAAPIAFAQLCWFYPQLWLQAARDKMYILQQYEKEDFTHIATPSPTAYFFSSSLLPGLKAAGNKFYALTAQVRASQALLRAEAYCREHGDYPETLPDLPTDPFTGKPMLYRYGTAEITRYVLRFIKDPSWTDEEKPYEEYDLAPQATQAKVVQVWSVGPNGRDEGGVSSVLINGKDDTSAKIRVKY